jgi:hypothetical protein
MSDEEWNAVANAWRASVAQRIRLMFPTATNAQIADAVEASFRQHVGDDARALVAAVRGDANAVTQAYR